jgi:hypothetical protein
MQFLRPPIWARKITQPFGGCGDPKKVYLGEIRGSEIFQCALL